MISSISLKNVATYNSSNEEIIIPKKINFIFGNNGSGKTTISNLISNDTDVLFKECKIKWEDDKKLKVLVYNRDFVKENFNSETKLRGIFTLGEESEETYKKIEDYNRTKKEKETLLYKNRCEENELKEELKKLKTKYVDILWEDYKRIYCDKTPELFKGFIKSKETFFDNIVSINNNEENVEFDKVIEDYNLLYKNDNQIKDLIININKERINELINDSILKQPIIENTDIKLSEVIEELNNSTWVQDGLQYLSKEKQICPFCQQSVELDFINKMYELFGGKFKENKNKFYKIKIELEENINNIKNLINNHFDDINDSKIIISATKKFDTIINELNKKNNDLRYVCNISDSLQEIDDLYEYINQINVKISINNEKINHITEAKNELCISSKQFIRNSFENKYSLYLSEKEIIENKITQNIDITKKVDNEIGELVEKIKELENSVTSISKTINNINDILKKFNYNNFRLKENEDNLTYSIIRPNGEDASETLSEGEFHFISFLYFYNLVFGSRNRSGLTEEHILVIDDPVTSMDNNTLFIISTLIRDLIELCKEDRRHIKQIFVLSHNLYFFKEVSYGYDTMRKANIWLNYFIVNKFNGLSSISNYQSNNPVKNSYEILWEQLRKKDYSDESNLNVMRRILEQYLNIIGMKGPNNKNNELINKFEGNEKIIVKSLLSYINDGSHSIMDGLSIASDVNSNKLAFDVFEKIFLILNQENHYKMMMKEFDD